MHFEDEMEFFETDPYTFLVKLLNTLLESVTATLDGINIPQKVKRELIASFSDELQKNFFIFEDFCIDQIFTFPKDFFFERKIADYAFNENINQKIENLLKLKEEFKYIQEKMRKNNLEMIRTKHQIDKMNNFISNTDVNELMSNTEFLKKLFKKTKNTLGSNKSGISTGLSYRFNELLENKEIKVEMKKKEVNQLMSIGSIDEIDEFRKNFLESQ